MAQSKIGDVKELYFLRKPSQGYATIDIQASLHGWVCDCLQNEVQELDTMIITAPDSLKSAFNCYAAMADEIEIVVHRIWSDLIRHRLLSGE